MKQTMQRIEINNFGPIKNVELDINDFTIFIGPQASGKSTIARAIYFFLSMEDILGPLFRSISVKKEDASAISIEEWKKLIDKKVNDYWDPVFFKKNTDITFYFDEDRSISLKSKGHSLHVTIGRQLQSKFNYTKRKLLHELKLLQGKDEHDRRFFYQASGGAQLVERILWDDSFYFQYIPAGRTIFANLFNKLSPGYSAIHDKLVRDFIWTTNLISDDFSSRSIEELLKRGHLNRNSRLHRSNVSEIYRYASKILQGRYRQIDKADHIQIDPDVAVPVSFSSSGQQESLWILLNMIYCELFYKHPSFTIIEEPEAHLFPTAQRDMMHALALYANCRKNRLLLTTHSPYILTPLNNFLYAHAIGHSSEKKRQEVNEKIIEENYWIDPKRFDCFFVENGKLEKLFDCENGDRMIDLEKLDTASAMGNEEFHKLFELED